MDISQNLMLWLAILLFFFLVGLIVKAYTTKRMDKLELRQFIWSICLLVIGLILLSTRHIEFGIILIIFSFFGIIIRISSSIKKIEGDIYSKEWTNSTMTMFIFSFILIVIINIFIFNEEIDLLEIFVGIIMLIGIYIYFRIIAPKYLIKIS